MQDVQFHVVRWKFIYGTFVSLRPQSSLFCFSAPAVDVRKFTIFWICKIVWSFLSTRSISGRRNVPKHQQQEVLICCFCNQEPPTNWPKTILAFNLNWSSLFYSVSKRFVLRNGREKFHLPSKSLLHVCHLTPQTSYSFLNFRILLSFMSSYEKNTIEETGRWKLQRAVRQSSFCCPWLKILVGNFLFPGISLCVVWQKFHSSTMIEGKESSKFYSHRNKQN